MYKFSGFFLLMFRIMEAQLLHDRHELFALNAWETVMEIFVQSLPEQLYR